MNAQLRALYDKKGQIVAQMEAIGKPVKDGTQKGGLTDEQRTQFRNWNDELKGIDKQIEDLNILSEVEAQRAVEHGNEVTRRDEQGKKEIRYADFKGMK